MDKITLLRLRHFASMRPHAIEKAVGGRREARRRENVPIHVPTGCGHEKFQDGEEGKAAMGKRSGCAAKQRRAGGVTWRAFWTLVQPKVN
jgi:hypothetical protein